jgi:transcriptional regulator with XRE-family HTH domain
VPIDGAKVRELRQNHGHTLKDFAPKAGITFQYLSLIERGDRPTVSPPVFVRICDALGIPEANRGSLRVA